MLYHNRFACHWNEKNVNYAKPSPSDPAGRFSKVQRGDFEKSEDSSRAAVDSMLTEDMLPIGRDYAMSLIDAFLVHYVAGLAEQADKMVQQF